MSSESPQPLHLGINAWSIAACMCAAKMPRNKRSMMLFYNKLSRAIVLATVIIAALVGYYALTVYVLPPSYQASLAPRKAAPVVTEVNLPTRVTLGQSFTISVTGTNKGDEIDMQTVSIEFPNFTDTGNIRVTSHNFRQTPMLVSKGKPVGSEYAGIEKTISAQYAIVEAISRPWASGSSYSIDLQVTPQAEGRFVVFIKSVALPHNGSLAHWPQDGILDQQKELVKVYAVDVAKA
jgi:hypothetical protein